MLMVRVIDCFAQHAVISILPPVIASIILQMSYGKKIVSVFSASAEARAFVSVNIKKSLAQLSPSFSKVGVSLFLVLSIVFGRPGNHFVLVHRIPLLVSVADFVSMLLSIVCLPYPALVSMGSLVFPI